MVLCIYIKIYLKSRQNWLPGLRFDIVRRPSIAGAPTPDRARIMDDPIRSHPTRGEQLDILVACANRVLGAGEVLIDLGCGTGYLAHLLLQARPDIRIIGVDRNPESLTAARQRFEGRAAFLEGDLSKIEAVTPPVETAKVVASALTFHDLSDDDKRAVLSWSVDRLDAEGAILLYDRIRLTEAETFGLQRAIWSRIERIHGAAMRTAESFDAYRADLSDTNRPASLADYQTWFAELGCAMQILHLHGNTALLGAVRHR